MLKRTWTAVLLAVLMVAAALPAVAADSGTAPESEASYELTEFNDTAGNTFENAINWLVDQGITVGCNPPTYTNFCPNDPVTRGQMAVFITRALSLPAASDDYFDDDNGAFYENSANRLFEAGISAGCNPPANNNFCGGEEVTRAQMATFLNRGFGLAATTVDYFTDDNGSVHETSINRVRSANITVGCNPPASDNFCPGDTVTRGQMSAFIKRAVEWLTNPQAPPPPPPSGGGGGGGGGTPPPQAGPCGGNTILSDAQCKALVTLYNSTGGAAWFTKTGWLTGNPCSWYGVVCTGVNVTALNLDQNNLTGQLPSLAAFTQLQTLDLTGNNLQGQVPSHLQNLKNLVTLRLDGNLFTGTLPGQLGNIGTQLRTLDIGKNPGISGSIPANLWNLTGLRVLNLSESNLSGGLSANIQNLTQLQTFNIGETAIGGTFPSAAFTAMSNLQIVNLSETLFTNAIPTNIGSMTSLQNLDLEDSTFLGPIPTSIGSLSNLTLLDLSGMDNLAGGMIPTQITNLTNLTFLDLRESGLTGAIPTNIGNIGASLTFFGLSDNNLGGATGADPNSLVPDSITSLTGLPVGSLRMANQGGNCFTFNLPATETFVNTTKQAQAPVCPAP